MTSKSQGIWVLGHAYKYEQSRRGRIKGSVEYEFFWEQAESRFVFRAGTETTYLPTPVALAEAFLLQCLDDSFRHRVITDSTCAVQESIEVGGVELCLRHCQQKYMCKHERFPGLSLTLESGGASIGYLFLPHPVRMDFGSTMARTMPEEVRMMLHPPIAA